MYMDFKKVSECIPFEKVLDWLAIAYTDKNGTLKGNAPFQFVITKAKNLYLDPQNKDNKGSVINFVARVKNLDLRSACKLLQEMFLVEHSAKPKQLPEYELDFTHSIVSKHSVSVEQCQAFECGYVKSRGVLSGMFGFKCRDHEGQLKGWIGLKKDDSWHYPKGLQIDFVYRYHALPDNKWAVLTTDPIKAIQLSEKYGQDRVLALLKLGMGERQEELLTQIGHIIISHPSPDNIILRLSKKVYVKQA